MHKPLKDMSFDELTALATGSILMGIGRGEKFSTLIHLWMHTAITWEQEKKYEKNLKNK